MATGQQQGIVGQQGIMDENSHHNITHFVARQEVGTVLTMMPVKIMKVRPDPNGGSPKVDVLPLVNQIDGIGTATKHETVYGIKVQRIQGGKSAFINDPVVGDVGFISISHRDISSVINSSGQQSNPGSFRRFNYADSVYVGHLGLNGAPNQYVQAKPAGGWKVLDSTNNSIETNAGSDIGVAVNPAPQMVVYLGGDGKTGTYSPVMTVAGPSPFVKARVS